MVCSMFRRNRRIETGVFLFQYPLEPLKTSIVRAEVPTLSYWNGRNPIVKKGMELFGDTGQNTIPEPFGMVSLEIISNTTKRHDYHSSELMQIRNPLSESLHLLHLIIVINMHKHTAKQSFFGILALVLRTIIANDLILH